MAVPDDELEKQLVKAIIKWSLAPRARIQALKDFASDAEIILADSKNIGSEDVEYDLLRKGILHAWFFSPVSDGGCTVPG